MKILITEDNYLTSKALAKIFKSPDNEIVCAYTALSAIQELENKPYDIALIDIYMPGFDGLELIKHIRNDLKLTLPIIVVTRDDYKDTIYKAFELGADDFVLKPFDPDTLFQKVQKLVNNA